MRLNEVKEGWKNHLFPDEEEKELIEKVSKERMDICNLCEEHSSNKLNYSTIRPDVHCTNCGCTLFAKTKCLTCECPLQKWTAVKIQNDETT